VGTIFLDKCGEEVFTLRVRQTGGVEVLSLWEELLILRAKWEERIKQPAHPADSIFKIDRLKDAHVELDELIKRHTRTKAPFDSQPR
jgi:hypothetical protein